MDSLNIKCSKGHQIVKDISIVEKECISCFKTFQKGKYFYECAKKEFRLCDGCVNDYRTANFRKLKSKYMKRTHEHNCAVCLEVFEKNSKLELLPCLHYFHENCIKKWLARKSCCPLCN